MAKPKKPAEQTAAEKNQKAALIHKATALHMLADPSAKNRQDDVLAAALRCYIAELENRAGKTG
jgi:hypothetical protein